MKASRWLWSLSVLLGILVCTQPLRTVQPIASTQPTGNIAPLPSRSTAELLTAMAHLAGAIPDEGHVAEWATKIAHGASIIHYIDELLEQKRFGDEIVPTLMFGGFVNIRNYYAVPAGFVLKQANGVFYLRQPCAESEAVPVSPWWALDTSVKVCPDSYKPDKWTITPSEYGYRANNLITCASQIGSPELETKPVCGCGPNLVRCLRDMDQYEELNKSLIAEVKETTAHVVANDEPIAALFTGNPTWRDRNAEAYYRRQTIGTTQRRDVSDALADLGSWPVAGKWAPRKEVSAGQHAGLLTAPQILHWLPDRRQRQRGYYEIMWCTMRNSFGATTQKVLDLASASGNLQFGTDSWARLAHTELCTNCHARLDYGFQFFNGYPDSRASTHFVPAMVSPGTGPLYGRDIDDPRGSAPLTPLGFATLASEQPEFSSCVANHFTSYVLGDQATLDDRAAVEIAYGTTHTFKGVMRVALERYASKWTAPRTPAVTSAVARTIDLPLVRVSPTLRKQLDRYCTDCHDKVPYTDEGDTGTQPYDLTHNTMQRALVVSMTERVAFGMMPKNSELDPTTRDALVGDLIASLWADPSARAEAENYYLSKGRGLPALQIDNAFFGIDTSARSDPQTGWGALERGIWSDQDTVTPGFLAETGLEALQACTQGPAPASGQELDRCLQRATSLDSLTRWSPLHVP